MKQLLCALSLVALVSACGGGNSSPAAPTPATPTKIINLSGSLSFGTVQIGASATATFAIANTGNTALTVTALQLPTAIVGAYVASFTNGSIAAGASQSVTVTFRPTAAIDYNGTLNVAADQTSGTNTIAISGTGAGLVPLTGVVSSSSGARISGAALRILDGPNSGKTTTTDGNGAYRFDNLTVGNANVSANATGFSQTINGVFINGATTLNFTLLPPPFTVSGTGDTVFNMPTTVSRVRINAAYSGNSSNFIVKIAGRLIVNELVGRAWNQTSFEGTYLTSGGVTEITNSSGVAWTFTEVR